MKRFSLRTVLIAFVAITLLLAWFREPLIRMIRPSEIPWTRVESTSDLEEMFACPNAFLFVHADWSLDSVMARNSVSEFISDWRWNHREPEIKVFLIDHSNKTPAWLIEWAKSNPDLSLAYNGYGEAIWLREGEVLRRLTGGFMISPEELEKATKELF